MTTFEKVRGLLLATLLVLSVFAGAVTLAGAATWDSGNSDVSGSSNTVEFYPGSESNNTVFYLDSVTAHNVSDLELRLIPDQAGLTQPAYTNSSAAEPATDDAEFNVSHKELENLPRDDDGGTYEAKIVNVTDGTVVENTTVTFDQSARTGKTAVIHLTDESGTDGAAISPLIADDHTHSVESRYLGFAEENISEFSAFTNIDANTTTTEVHLENSTAADDFSQAATGVDDGTWMGDARLYANGVPVPVYKNSAPDSPPTLYATYHNDSDVLRMHHGDAEALDGTANLYLEGTAGKSMGFNDIWSTVGITKALGSLAPW